MVDEMLAIKSKPTYKIGKISPEEKEVKEKIDSLVMELYELSEKERKLVKEFTI
jgi:hypothetical protein